MKAFVAKLDNPHGKEEWFTKVFDVSAPEDVAGFIGRNVYVELFDIGVDERKLYDQCWQVVDGYDSRARDMISLLFNIVDGLRRSLNGTVSLRAGKG